MDALLHHESSWTFDAVYGPEGLEGAKPGRGMYDQHVAPLVDGLFNGYNATGGPALFQSGR